MPEIKIRPATLDDAAAIAAIHQSTVDTWKDPATHQRTSYEVLDLYGRWRNGGAWMSVETCAVHLNRLLHEGEIPLIAEIDGVPVGEAEYIISREPAPFASLHLSILYIHAQWQGHGVGQALMDAGIAHALRLRLPALTTQPEKDAEAFYTHLGFAPWHKAKEMQLSTRGAEVPTVLPYHKGEKPFHSLALRIGRYQCGPQGWHVLKPALVLPPWSDLRRWVWLSESGDGPVVLGLCEQLTDPTQADGYAWLLPDAPLKPVVAALQGLGAEQGFSAVDLLLPAAEVPALKQSFRLDYQTQVTIWRKAL